MIIKRYLVTNMNEAMTRIRYELGMDAVIISQRKVRKPGVSGFFSKKIIEVTAAVDNSKEEKEKLVAEKEDIQNSINALKKMIQDQPTEK
ncbi:MAG TPA: flagellar biosynthesis protein FlhF, partial [Clostridium sp.]|nr:flagellar biosynthesis protein FlhF [Clostridium sp.]